MSLGIIGASAVHEDGGVNATVFERLLAPFSEN